MDLMTSSSPVQHLEATFGNLILLWNNFTNCGVRHVQCTQTYTITLDQIEYCNALKPMAHPTVKAAHRDNIVPQDLFEQFRSLRGAVAYTQLTRTDISVYVVFLQRQTETTTNYGHIRMLNTLVHRLQKSPQVLRYEYLGANTKFLVLTDSAFKKEEQTGHSLKGTLLLRIPDNRTDISKGRLLCHILDHNTKQIKNVTRSTCSAELFGLCDAGKSFTSSPMAH
jgi:hypothetical protein